jgi:integrase
VPGHITKRNGCAASACDGTILSPDEAARRGKTAHRCSKCGGRASTLRWRARHPDPSKGGTAQLERTFSTRRDAEDWLDELKQSARSGPGQFIDPRAKVTVAAIVEVYRRTRYPDLGPKTKAGYEAILRSYVLPRFGKARVNALTTQVIQEWVNQLRDGSPNTGKPKAPNTVRRIYTVLRNCLVLAVEQRYIAVNPCDGVRLPRKRSAGTRREGQRFLAPVQVRALAEAMPEHYRVATYVAASCGLRAGELWALRRNDIDLLRGTLRVDESLKQIESKYHDLPEDERGMVFGPPKSEAALREFTLPAHTRKLLEAHLASPLGGTESDALIFTTPSGKPVRHNLFYRRVFKPAVRRALPPELHGFRWHDLRHTAASLMLEVAPAAFMLVKERLGHENIRTTIDVYGHLSPSADGALADSLSRLFESADADADADERSGNVVELVKG